MKKIFIYILTIFMLLTFTSCAQEPEVIVTSAIECIISEDLEGLQSYVTSFTYHKTDFPKALSDALKENLTYTVDNITKDGKNHLVEVTFTNISSKAVQDYVLDKVRYLTFDPKTMSGESVSKEISQLYEEAVEANKNNTVSTTVPITVIKIKGSRICDIDEVKSEEILNAIYGLN